MLLTHSCPPGLVVVSTELQYGGVGEPEVHCSSLPFPGNPALVCQAGNKPCPPLDKGWEWDAHIHFQVLLIRSHSPCRFPGRKGQRVKEASFTPALPSSLPFQACFSSGPTPAWGEQPAEQSCPCRICTHFHQSCLAAQEQHWGFPAQKATDSCMWKRRILCSALLPQPSPEASSNKTLRDSAQENLGGEEAWTLQWDHHLDVALEHSQDHVLPFSEHNPDT